MKSGLCVTVTAPTLAELRSRRDQVVDADLLELRLDTVRDPDAAGALEGRRLPAILTCRAKWEGGYFEGSEEERRRLLGQAQEQGAEWIDVEWKAGFEELISARGGRGVIVSSHSFDGTPPDLPARVAAMRSTGAEVTKVAIMAERLSDCLTLLDVDGDSSSTVLLAMGDAGLCTRVLPDRFHSRWTYAGDRVAPGQIPASRLLAEFAFRRVSGAAAIYGVVGRPVLHSVSPAMHNAAFEATRLDAVYLPLTASDFDDFLKFAAGLQLCGASVTAPFKVDAFHAAGEVDPTSRAVESVNTLRRTARGWGACSTDGSGFLAPLAAAIEVRGCRATVMGSGGAARAVAGALQSAGARVAISARNRSTAERVAELTQSSLAAWPPAAGSWDVLVNATPVGTAPHVEQSPLPDGPFEGELVYDLVYNPPETRLLADARAAGCRTIGGLEMLVAQAGLQFEWWTGQPAPTHVMRDAAIRALMGTSRD